MNVEPIKKLDLTHDACLTITDSHRAQICKAAPSYFPYGVQQIGISNTWSILMWLIDTRLSYASSGVQVHLSDPRRVILSPPTMLRTNEVTGPSTGYRNLQQPFHVA
jgi:hypothetical protein